ncbi:MAG: hypothetical protein KGI51_04765 [Rhodospirillales bacterium]|nr:hypothetical protein [Rhodospirillales bacterium]
MPVIADAATARGTRRRAVSNGTNFWHTSFIGGNRYRPDPDGPPARGALYPMAFLVEQDAHEVVEAHFHQADQFQVVVAGEGTLGTHAVRPVAVHFTGPYTAYGPIRAGAEGLSYYTLRNGWDPGARYMPGARAELPRPRSHREAVGSIEAPEVLAEAPDGMGARRIPLAPGEAIAGPDPASGGGQYWLVLSGALAGDAGALGAGSCIFVRPDEAPFAPEAGADGAEVLLMQFPRRG